MSRVNLGNKKLLDQITRHEGLRLKPYRDTEGKLTIGVGRNLDDIGITESEALTLLLNDIERTERLMDLEMPWWRDLSMPRQRVMVNWAFNVGVRGVRGFRKAIAAIQAEDWQEAGAQMLDSKWAEQVGKRADELAHSMVTGEECPSLPG